MKVGIKMLLIGDCMPEMKVQTTKGMKMLPDDYKGNWLILFSHPGDFTPVCTTEFFAFSKNQETFDKLNAKLLGLSVDQVQPHMKWTEWIEQQLGEEIKFPIIADPLGQVAHKLGMIQTANSSATVRATFFIDPSGMIRLILYYPSEIGRNMEEIIRCLVALQVADENKVATPADWPHNELIGDQVIIKPATCEAEAKKNIEMYEHYDWWFAYKPLE